MLAAGASTTQHLAPEVLSIIFEIIATSSSSGSLSLPPLWNIGQESSLSTHHVKSKQEDKRRRWLAALEPCTRVCKAWYNPAISILYKRVDFVCGFSNGDETEKDSSWKGAVPFSRIVTKGRKRILTLEDGSREHQWNRDLTRIGQYVRHVHLWAPPLGPKQDPQDSEVHPSFYSKARQNGSKLIDEIQSVLNALAPNIITLHDHHQNYDGYQSCWCNEFGHRHRLGRGLE
ncbi:hypothetical protein HDU76_000751, partial [Blyttiomyces sp. JEL0837]